MICKPVQLTITAEMNALAANVFFKRLCFSDHFLQFRLNFRQVCALRREPQRLRKNVYESNHICLNFKKYVNGLWWWSIRPCVGISVGRFFPFGVVVQLVLGIGMKDEFSGLGDYETFTGGHLGGYKKAVSAYVAFGKRAFDVVFALAALIVVSPLVAGLWILVRRDGGSGFFGHKRVGLHGREFACWKLRTMTPHAEKSLQAYLQSNPEAAAEWSATMKLKNDPRITSLGRFVRRSRMDELPQFWNVLIGDMSIVGPRPVTGAEILRYGPAAALVLSQRPGVTGPWQVSGVAGEDYAKRVEMDKQYVRDLSFALDISIIFKTVLTVFRMTGH